MSSHNRNLNARARALRPEHVRYLTANSRGNGVRVLCTCGTSHGAESYPSFEMAMETGRFDGFVKYWRNNDEVTRMCRDYAEKGTGIETLRGLLAFR